MWPSVRFALNFLGFVLIVVPLVIAAAFVVGSFAAGLMGLAL